MEGPADIFSGDWLAVGEADVGAEMDADPVSVGVVLPSVREDAFEFKGFGVEGGEGFTDLITDAAAVDIFCENRGDFDWLSFEGFLEGASDGVVRLVAWIFHESGGLEPADWDIRILDPRFVTLRRLVVGPIVVGGEGDP